MGYKVPLSEFVVLRMMLALERCQLERRRGAVIGNQLAATRWALPGWAAKCQWHLLEWQ